MTFCVDGQMAKSSNRKEDAGFAGKILRGRRGGAGGSRRLEQEGTGMGKSDTHVSREQGMFREEGESRSRSSKEEKEVLTLL